MSERLFKSGSNAFTVDLIIGNTLIQLLPIANSTEVFRAIITSILFDNDANQAVDIELYDDLLAEATAREGSPDLKFRIAAAPSGSVEQFMATNINIEINRGVTIKAIPASGNPDMVLNFVGEF